MSEVKALLKDMITGLAHIGHIVTDLDVAVENFKRVYGVDDADIMIPPNPPGIEVQPSSHS